MDTVLPLEETDPFVAEQLRLIVNGKHPTVRGLSCGWQRREYHLWSGECVVGTSKPPGRNDACPCGSRLKYKKCCGR